MLFTNPKYFKVKKEDAPYFGYRVKDPVSNKYLYCLGLRKEYSQKYIIENKLLHGVKLLVRKFLCGINSNGDYEEIYLSDARERKKEWFGDTNRLYVEYAIWKLYGHDYSIRWDLFKKGNLGFEPWFDLAVKKDRYSTKNGFEFTKFMQDIKEPVFKFKQTKM